MSVTTSATTTATTTTSGSRSTSTREAPSRAPLRPTGLTVLYDAQCPVCRKARRWTERHRQLVPIRFVAAGSDLARYRFPELDVGSTSPMSP